MAMNVLKKILKDFKKLFTSFNKCIVYNTSHNKGWMAEWLCSGLQSRSSGSIPDSASKILKYFYFISIIMQVSTGENNICPSGGIGRHKGLKIPR